MTLCTILVPILPTSNDYFSDRLLGGIALRLPILPKWLKLRLPFRRDLVKSFGDLLPAFRLQTINHGSAEFVHTSAIGVLPIRREVIDNIPQYATHE